MKVALVGCGKIADGHVEQIRKMPERATVVAVCDLEPLMAEQLARRFEIPAHYTDFDALLEKEKPDVVHIATPPGSHLPLALRSIEGGAHVYVEKPLTVHYADSKKLIAAANAAGRKLTIGYTYMLDEPAVMLRELVARGDIGEIVHMESFFGYNLAGGFGAAIMGDANNWVHRLPGALLQNNIDHMLQKIVEFAPAALSVHAWGAKRRPERFDDVRDKLVDELRVMLTAPGFSAYGTFSSHIRPATQWLRVYGTEGSVDLDFVTRTVTPLASTTLPSAIGRIVPAFEQAARYASEGMRNVGAFARSQYHFFEGLERLIGAFYDCIENDGPPPVPYEQILEIGRLVDDIIEQLAAQFPTAQSETTS